MKKKKKRDFIDKRLVNLQNKVTSNLHKLCDFNVNIKLNNVVTNSCYDFKKCKLDSTFDFKPIIDNTSKDIPKYKSKIVDLIVEERPKFKRDAKRLMAALWKRMWGN